MSYFYFIKFSLLLIFRTAQIVPRLLAVLVSFTYSSYKTFYLLFVKTCFIRKILYNKFAWLIHYSYLGNLPNVLYKVWNYANKIVDELNHMGILWRMRCSNSHLMNLTKGDTRGLCKTLISCKPRRTVKVEILVEIWVLINSGLRLNHRNLPSATKFAPLNFLFTINVLPT